MPAAARRLRGRHQRIARVQAWSSCASTGAAGAAGAARPARAKLSYKEQRELDALPARIAALEAEQAALSARLADPATYQGGAAGDLKAMNERVGEIEAELLECLERWEALEARA